MVNLSTFQAYLAAKPALLEACHKSNRSNEPYLRQWAILLPAQTEAQQLEQIEKVLTELRSTAMDDRQRLTLIQIVVNVANQLIAALRQHYIYETGALNEAQLGYVAQVKSLYYSLIMTCDGVIQREISYLKAKSPKSPAPARSLWQRYFSNEKSSPVTLAIAIYQTLLMYQKLLFEDGFCYQKPPEYIWGNINKCYRIAYQQQASHIVLSAYIPAQQGDTIHHLYRQICLHELLNVRALRRPHILLLQRLLPVWSAHVVATIELRTETRVFVNLESKEPPIYLTALSTINPYDPHHTCLFIELKPLVIYLQSRIQTLIDTDRRGVEYHLLNSVSMAINYRYIQPKRIMRPIDTREPGTKQTVTLIAGFNEIHYHINNGEAFSRLIASKNLPEDQQPRYDTLPKNTVTHKVLRAETAAANNQSLHFRTLRLLLDSSEPSTSSKPSEPWMPTDKIDDRASIAPPLQIMGLFLLCREDMATAPKWSIGVVRWLNLDSKRYELEWQVLGHQLIACGIGLQDRQNRSQHFVPALVIGADEHLQTPYSLLLPTSHFQTDDKVLMRINDQQKSLRLGRILMVTDEFSQYAVVQG